jgi:allantoicase
MRSIRFFLGCEPPSAAPHACDKEESADGRTKWVKIRRSITCADMDPITLAAADVVRRSEKM